MDNFRIRGRDIISAILFFILGVFILLSAFQMPLRDSFAGVISVWYVSPGLFPLIIGIGTILLSFAIFRHALKQGGFQQLKEMFEQRKKITFLSEANIRYASILVPLFALVYVNMTRIDIFFAFSLFLVFTIAAFYLESFEIMKKLLFFYTIQMGILFILTVTKLDIVLNNVFANSMDVIALIMLVSLNCMVSYLIKKYTGEQKKKLRHIIAVSYITPVAIIMFFKFMLRIPMPKEGAIVDLFLLVQWYLR
jgi:hypothetical protein